MIAPSFGSKADPTKSSRPGPTFLAGPLSIAASGRMEHPTCISLNNVLSRQLSGKTLQIGHHTLKQGDLVDALTATYLATSKDPNTEPGWANAASDQFERETDRMVRNGVSLETVWLVGTTDYAETDKSWLQASPRADCRAFGGHFRRTDPIQGADLNAECSRLGLTVTTGTSDEAPITFVLATAPAEVPARQQLQKALQSALIQETENAELSVGLRKIKCSELSRAESPHKIIELGGAMTSDGSWQLPQSEENVVRNIQSAVELAAEFPRKGIFRNTQSRLGSGGEVVGTAPDSVDVQ